MYFIRDSHTITKKTHYCTMLLLPFEKEITQEDFDKIEKSVIESSDCEHYLYPIFSVLYDIGIIATNSEIVEMINSHFK